MSKTIRHDDARISWEGAVSVMRTPDWTMPWRIPHEQQNLLGVTDPKLVNAARSPSGVRLSLRSDTRSLSGRVLLATTGTDTVNPFTLDLCVNDRHLASCVIDSDGGFGFTGLPPGNKLLELWLPLTDIFRLQSLELDDGAEFEPFKDGRPRWTMHGSSIEHCSGAKSPTQSWPAIVARGSGLNLTSMGFGGACHLDPLVAQIIATLPADFISFATGTNSLIGPGYNERTFRFLLAAFVKTIRQGHPQTPIAVVSPIYCVARDTGTDTAGEFWRGMRPVAGEIVELLKAEGDRHLYYVDGRDLLGEADKHLLRDNVHPGTEGYKLIGRNFLKKVIPVVFP